MTLQNVRDRVDAKIGSDALTQELRAAAPVGLKFDQGKPTFSLLPDDALAEIQKVLDFGAKKYAARNWEKGFAWMRPWNGAMRHLWAWARREKVDPETGLSHLAHAGCMILFLIAHELRKIGEDNRPPAPPVKEELVKEALCGPHGRLPVDFHGGRYIRLPGVSAEADAALDAGIPTDAPATEPGRYSSGVYSLGDLGHRGAPVDDEHRVTMQAHDDLHN